MQNALMAGTTRTATSCPIYSTISKERDRGPGSSIPTPSLVNRERPSGVTVVLLSAAASGGGGRRAAPFAWRRGTVRSLAQAARIVETGFQNRKCQVIKILIER